MNWPTDYAQRYGKTMVVGTCVWLSAMAVVWGIVAGFDRLLLQVRLPEIGTPSEGLPARVNDQPAAGYAIEVDFAIYQKATIASAIVFKADDGVCMVRVHAPDGSQGVDFPVPSNWCEGMR